MGEINAHPLERQNPLYKAIKRSRHLSSVKIPLLKARYHCKKVDIYLSKSGTIILVFGGFIAVFSNDEDIVDVLESTIYDKSTKKNILRQLAKHMPENKKLLEKTIEYMIS